MEYKTFNKKNANSTVITGVRHTDKNKYKKSKNVLLTGYYKMNGNHYGYIYRGNCIDSNDGFFYPVKFPGSYVTTPYGPDRTSDDTVSIVGNYNFNSNSPAIGFLYNGPYKNTTLGTWISIIPPFKNAMNTIAHSVMNGMVVGNYGLHPEFSLENKSRIYAFLYNSHNNQYYNINIPNIDSISAYGIWHNEDNSYTIAGGYSKKGNNKAYIVDWNSETGIFTNWTTYKFDNDNKTLITHFDGITGIKKGVYNLTGDCLNNKTPNAFFCTVDRINNITKWSTIKFPDSKITSGNTVIDNKVYGVYLKNNVVNGYVYLHNT